MKLHPMGRAETVRTPAAIQHRARPRAQWALFPSLTIPVVHMTTRVFSMYAEHQVPTPDADWVTLSMGLRARLDALVGDFRSRWGAAGQYPSGLVSDEDLLRTAYQTMEALVIRLAGEDLPGHLVNTARDLGVRRARQGVPLEALLAAVRIDVQVLWSALAAAAGPGSEALLVRHVELVLQTVERYISEVQQGFLAEEAILRRNARIITSRYITRLFTPPACSPEELAEIAARIRVPLKAAFDVIVVTGEGAVLAQEPAAGRELDASWRLHELPGAVCYFRPARAIFDPAPFSGLAAGHLGEVGGLGAVPQAAQGALLLARFAGRETRSVPVSTAEGWVPLAHELLSATLPGFGVRVREALDGCVPHERQRLLQTVGHFVTTGSIKQTAEAMYCHRNTVVNRLDAFRSLTGLDVTIPSQAALVLVFLGSLDLRVS